MAEAFQIVLDSDARIYKVLTWLAQSLFVIEYDITRIQSTDTILREFSEKNLFYMRDKVLSSVKKIEWIVVTPKQIARINRALNIELDKFDNKRIGELQYKDFFVKKGGRLQLAIG